ncbi:hypothetical protein BX666DRAFT_1856457 [Dichotomocladium elegans]|nr:hypothetical protein BX666DRAFT_1856457 [Dichotomocladium elegans]
MHNSISKLPSSETAQVIGETELITNYLDPILSPMFHNPRKGRVFRWLNRTGNETANRRPNGGMAITKQMHGVFETGFVEAKPAEMSTHHTVTHRDTYRLAIFCKDAIDRGEVKCTIGVQAVGFTIDFYLCAAVHDEMYIFMHFSRITVPSSLAALRPFLMHLRGCKQVVAAYNKHCVLRVDNDSMRPEQNRPSLTDDVLADVLHNVNNTKLPTVRFP